MYLFCGRKSLPTKWTWTRRMKCWFQLHISTRKSLGHSEFPFCWRSVRCVSWVHCVGGQLSFVCCVGGWLSFVQFVCVVSVLMHSFIVAGGTLQRSDEENSEHAWHSGERVWEGKRSFANVIPISILFIYFFFQPGSILHINP